MKTKFLLPAFSFMITLILFFPNSTFAQGTWTQKADFPGGVKYSASGFSIGTKIYVGIGFNDADWPTRDFWEWDQTTNIWTRKTDFPGSIEGSAVSFSIGTKGYIGTGFFWDSGFPDLVYFNDFWEYYQDTDTWTRKADFGGAARGGAVGFSIGNKGYIGMGSNGSFDNSSGFLKDFWEYDQETDFWTRKPILEGSPDKEQLVFL